MSRKIVLITLVVLLVVVGGYFAYTTSNRTATAATTNVQTATVTRGNLIATVNNAGPVAARAQVMLNFGTAGIVKQVHVKLGDQVKQGQVLAELEATELQFALANAQLAFNQAQIKYEQAKKGPTQDELAVAQLAVESAQASYDLAVKKAGLNDAQLVLIRVQFEKATIALQKAQYEYDKAVVDRKTDLTAVSTALQQAKLDYESAQANYNIQIANLNDSAVRSAAAQLISAKSNLQKLQDTPTPQDLQIAGAQLEQAKLSLQQAQYRMRNVQLIAPFDGTITQVNIDAFSNAAANTQAVQISDLKTLQVTVNMAEVDVGKVKTGQDVNITFDALPDRPTVTGKVTQIALVGVTTQGVVNYPVVVTLNDPDPSVVKTGMTANVAIVVDKRDNVLLVPSRAIRTSGRQRVVQVQTAMGAMTVPITTGLQNDSQSEVLTGLKDGDVVVITTTQRQTTTGGGFGGPGGPGGGPIVVPR